MVLKENSLGIVIKYDSIKLSLLKPWTICSRSMQCDLVLNFCTIERGVTNIPIRGAPGGSVG